MAVNLKMDATTLAEVLAATTVNARITALKTAMGTGTQTVSIKNDSAVEKLTGTFAGTAYSDSAVDFIPRTALGSVSGDGGTAAADWTLRVTNGSSRWFEAEFGTGETWAATKALDNADTTYLTLNLGWQASTGGGVQIVEGMSKWWFDPEGLFSEATTAKRQAIFSGHLTSVYGNNYNCALSAVPNTGLVDPSDSKTKLARVANGSSYVFRHVLSKNQPRDVFSTHRMQFWPNYGNAGQQIPHGEEVWIAFAFKSPAITTAGSGLIFGESISVAGDSGLYFYFGSSTGRISIESWFNPTADGPRTAALDSLTGSANSPSQLYSTPVARSTWMHYVIKARFSYQTSDNPYLQVWEQAGSAAAQQVVANTLRNAWNTPTGGQWSFPRLGQYYFTTYNSDGTIATNYGDPWNGAANGTDQTLDYAGCVVVPVSAAAGAQYTDFLAWLTARTGA